jgi:hypothetical protein
MGKTWSLIMSIYSNSKNYLLIASTTLIVSACGFVQSHIASDGSGNTLKLLDPYYEALKTSLVTADFCTLPPENAKPKLKFVFVIDKSSSNKLDFDPPVGTDPVGDRRFPPILQFAGCNDLTGVNNRNLCTKAADPTVSYSLSFFSDGFKNERTFTTDPKELYDTVFNQWNDRCGTDYSESINKVCTIPADFGWTNYIEAILGVKEFIKKDLDEEKKNSNVITSTYVIFFVTDGAPIVAIEAGVEKIQTTDSIVAAVKNLVSLTVDDDYKNYVDAIQLHTGFYTNPVRKTNPATGLMEDINPPIEYYGCVPGVLGCQYSIPSCSDDDALKTFFDSKQELQPFRRRKQAECRLKAMSYAGNRGEFISFLNNEPIDFSKFSLPDQLVTKGFMDVFVINESIGWFQGSLYPAPANDGIPEPVKNYYGASLSKRDSDDNGVSDRVETILYNSPCLTKPCSASTARAMVQSCGAMPVGGYGDKDGDGLNDCEEKKLQSDEADFDTNGNAVPDGVEAWYGVMPSSNPLYIDSAAPALDGESIYEKIKAGLPLDYPAALIPNVKRQIYRPTLVSRTATQACYHLEVSDFYTIGNDQIAIYLMENNLVRQNLKFLRVGRKRFNGSINFSNSEIK